MPPSLQASVFAKVLTFDRNLASRAAGELRIGVLFQSKVRISLDAKDEFLKAMCPSPAQAIEGIPVRCVEIEWANGPGLDAALARERVRVLYLAPLRAVAIEEIVAVSRARKVTTLTGVPGFVEKGVALGLALRAERPLILVHLPAARAEGADFNSQLLKLARVFFSDSEQAAGSGSGLAP